MFTEQIIYLGICFEIIQVWVWRNGWGLEETGVY